MKDDCTEGWVALNQVRGLTPRALALLLERFGDPDGIAAAPGPVLADAVRLPERALHDLAALGSPQSRRRARQEIARARALGAEVRVRTGPGYPGRLLEGVPDPPAALYVRGALVEGDACAVAVVGSRRATPYGLEVARRLARDLAMEGYTIISGLARGVDAAAHRGALDAGGRTIAVLGCGIDRIYPPAHAALAEEIVRHGAMVSEFPLGTAPLAFNFPVRNRLISGLSRMVVVVEAAEGSGSLITAGLAGDQGREVGAVPGPVTSPLSAGTLRLILDGARLVRGWRDVAEEIPEALRPAPEARRAPSEASLGERARRILSTLSPEAPRHLDVIAGDLRESAGALLADLLDLELKRLVVSLPGGHFLRRG